MIGVQLYFNIFYLGIIGSSEKLYKKQQKKGNIYVKILSKWKFVTPTHPTK